MENEWGVRFVTHTAKRFGRRTFTTFQTDIERAIPGYTLYSVQMCGTDANGIAIRLATNNNYDTCLFAIGSYIGGDETHQLLSSSGSERYGLALPKAFDEANTRTQRQTIPLPYHVPNASLDKEELRAYETRCLLHLHRRLLHGVLTGFPIRALLMEYILGGNGGELSLHFLERLGRLLLHFDVSVIVDEILTGGRAAGDSVVLTTGMPLAFDECICCITMGKMVSCGLVLVRKASKVTAVAEELRGFSTQAEYGQPSKLFDEVVQRIQAGMVEVRRKEVLKLMNCADPSKWEDHWGRGLQIYTSYSRARIMKGLRNRLLPRLEQSKLKKNQCTRSIWNRKTVCHALVASSDEWITRQFLAMKEGQYNFLCSLITFLFHTSFRFNPDDRLEGTLGVAVVPFRPEEVVAFIGQDGETMAAQHNEWTRKEKGRRSNAKVDTLVKRAIGDCIANSRDSRILWKKRVGYDRSEYVMFDRSSLEIYLE